jgi:hypothetical protein
MILSEDDYIFNVTTLYNGGAIYNTTNTTYISNFAMMGTTRKATPLPSQQNLLSGSVCKPTT